MPLIMLRFYFRNAVTIGGICATRKAEALSHRPMVALPQRVIILFDFNDTAQSGILHPCFQCCVAVALAALRTNEAVGWGFTPPVTGSGGLKTHPTFVSSSHIRASWPVLGLVIGRVWPIFLSA